MNELKKEWPELYGFWVYGEGPTYVVRVAQSSIAEAAGIRVGDRIIEIDSENVADKSAQYIKECAKRSKNKPPPISVQAHVQEANLIYDSRFEAFGVSIRSLNDGLPVALVDRVVKNSPADLTGIRKNDLIIEANGAPIRSDDTLKSLLRSNSPLIVKYVPVNRETGVVIAESKRELGHDWSEEKLGKAKEFYDQMNIVFANDPDKKKAVINQLRDFSENGNLFKLAEGLNTLLVTPEERALLKLVKLFIPVKQQELFDVLISKSKKETKMSKEVTIPAGIREVAMKKNKNENFGFAYKVSDKIIIDSVEPGSIAEAAGLYANDIILNVNGLKAEGGNLDYCIDALKKNSLILEVIQRTEYETKKKKKRTPSVSKSEIIQIEEKSFKEKVREVLNVQEKVKVKKILLDYNLSGEIEDFLARMNKVLDTPAKRSLWLYLLPILEEEHEQLARVFLSKHNILLIDKKKKSSSQESGLDSEHISKRTRFKSERFRRSTSNMHEDSREFGSTRSENINLKETKKTRPFSSSSSLQQSLVDDSELVVKFIKQVSYLLNMRERNELKYALKDYNESRDITIFMDLVDNIFDTPAKQTLWFHIIPLLDEDDQEHAKRKLWVSQSRDSVDLLQRAYLMSESVRGSGGGESSHINSFIDNEIDNLFDFTSDKEDGDKEDDVNSEYVKTIGEEKLIKKTSPKSCFIKYKPVKSNIAITTVDQFSKNGQEYQYTSSTKASTSTGVVNDDARVIPIRRLEARSCSNEAS